MCVYVCACVCVWVRVWVRVGECVCVFMRVCVRVSVFIIFFFEKKKSKNNVSNEGRRESSYHIIYTSLGLFFNQRQGHVCFSEWACRVVNGGELRRHLFQKRRKKKLRLQRSQCTILL